MVWTGHGWLGAFVLAASIIAPKEVMEHRFGAGAFLDSWTAQAACVAVSVAGCWVIGRLLNRGLPTRVIDTPRTVLDPGSGAPIYQPPTGHTVAFLRVEYAGWLQVAVLLLMHLERAGFFR